MSHNETGIRLDEAGPRPWNHEESFNDLVYEWMSKAPWLLISLALHFVVALIVAAIPWNAFDVEESPVMVVSVEPPVETVEPEEPEPEVEIEDVETEIEPVLEELEISDVSETDNDSDLASTEGDEGLNDSPHDSISTNSTLGLGAGGGSKIGRRFGRPKGRGPGGRANVAVQAGLQWLADHQDHEGPDAGSWDCDEFMKHDPGGDRCTGAGDANHDVGVTALALLAFLGDGHSMVDGRHRKTVTDGVRWLIKQQDSETGLVGDDVSKEFLYGHAIATLALSEVALIDQNPVVKRAAQKAVRYITKARNAYGAWRYEVPPNGDADASVTGWMLFALRSAKDAGLKVDESAFTDSIAWFDEMTDVGTGRCGYVEQGSLSSRVPGMNEHYPREHGEAMTAVSLLCRFFLGQDPKDVEIMKAHADLLLETLPKWSDDGLSNDMYYWYYGS
ncbi:MAG: prenyltransferase/squalene oxidase repeat-containing protein, partial [Planctomycetota bacterium]